MMREFRFIFFILFIAGCQITSAQVSSDNSRRNIEVSGIVYSGDDNEPIPGASVIIRGTTIGISTGVDGKFSLNVNESDTLEFSFIGYKTKLFKVGSKRDFSIVLDPDIMRLNEVIVVGYGSQERRNLTGSVTSIKANELEALKVSFDNALIGKVAGLQINSSSGTPGSATSITIRGLSTLNDQANAPLIVIDGVPVYGTGKDLNNTDFSNSSSPLISFGETRVNNSLESKSEFERNPLSNLNPDDIESIEILKDAFATAIYGSRGATGVILVTTKKGKQGTPRINFRYETGLLKPIGTPDLLNGEQYNEIYTKYNELKGLNKPFTSPYNTNWLNEVLRTAVTHEANMSVSAGTDKSNYYISGSYLDNPSYIINNDFKRYTGRVNLNYRGSDHFSFGTNMSVNFTDNNALNAQKIYRQAILKAPNLPIVDDQGEYVYDKGSNPDGIEDSNPVAYANTNINYLQDTRTLGNVFFEYTPWEWLVLKSVFGIDLYNSRGYNRQASRPTLPGGEAIESLAQNRKLVLDNTASIRKRIGENHFINSVFGQSFETSTEQRTNISGTNFFHDFIQSIGAASATRVRSSLQQKWALVSYFFRVNYQYRDKYLAGVSYRIDGSSRFNKNERYVGFPSFSLGWKISEEGFMERFTKLDELKIRGSVGFAGVQGSGGYYGNQGQYVLNDNNSNYAGLPILEIKQPNNPNLGWEKTRSLNLGLDLSMFDSRFTLTYDFYHRKINNMLYSSAIPLYQGWSSQVQNIGAMENYGMELTISSLNISRSEFKWSSTFNISGNRNRVLKLNFEGGDIGFAEAGYKYLKEGEPAGQFFLYDWVSVDPMTGDPLWRDADGNISNVPPASKWRVVDDVNVNRKPYGTSMPDFYGGFGNIISFRNFEMNAFISFSQGGKMINGSRATLLTYSTKDANNLSTEILNYWKIPGMETTIPRLTNPSITKPYGVSSPSDAYYDYTTSRTITRFLEDASYIRLRTLVFTYTFDKKITGRIKGLNSLRVYIKATNLFTLTKYSGIDPEVNAFGSSAIMSGYDELTMPQAKVIQFGINMGL